MAASVVFVFGAVLKGKKGMNQARERNNQEGRGESDFKKTKKSDGVAVVSSVAWWGRGCGLGQRANAV